MVGLLRLEKAKVNPPSPDPLPLPRGALLAGEGGEKMPPSPDPLPPATRGKGEKILPRVRKVPSLTSEAQLGEG